jgi:hypothetical protein
MILFLAESNDDTFQLGIGLSSSDLDLVRDGRPIGATFCERGFFGPETEIIHSKDSL